MIRVEIPDLGKTVDLTIDHTHSYIFGQILADRPDALFFYIAIQSHRTRVPYTGAEKQEYGTDADGYDEHCSAEIMNLTFPIRNWRDLDSQSIDVAYELEHVHPILPDNPANFYFGSCHHVPNDNRICFGGRTGSSFVLQWCFKATAYAGDTGKRVAIRTRLRCAGLRCYSEMRLGWT